MNAKRGAIESVRTASLYPVVDKSFAARRNAAFDSLIRKRERGATPIGPSRARDCAKSLSLSVQIGVLVNDPVRLGPRNEPVAKSLAGMTSQSVAAVGDVHRFGHSLPTLTLAITVDIPVPGG